MNITKTKQEKFIKLILSKAAAIKLSKLDIIGLLELTKLIIYNNDQQKAIDDISLLQFVNHSEAPQEDFIKVVLVSFIDCKLSLIDGIGLLETTKLMIYKTDFN